MTESKSRPTICDGEVVTFAQSFTESVGALGPLHEARGAFEVSASRNAVCVHRAELKSDDDVTEFLQAIAEASMAARRLTRERWGGNYRITVNKSSALKENT